MIIGGGIAGLTAGIYGRKSGYEVDLFEKNPVAGGLCTGWSRRGHHIDNCIHWLTGTKENTRLRKLWEEVGALLPETKFVENDKFFTSYVGKESATLWKDLERTERELLLLSPEDEAEIRTFIQHVRYAHCCQMPVEKPMDMMNVRDILKIGKEMGNIPKVMKEYGHIDMKDMAARFRHPVLKALFMDYMFKEYVASSFIISYATVADGNGEVPVGGSLAMANRMLDKFKELGGRFHGSSPVKKVLISGKKAEGIELENGEVIQGDYVICATDTMEMFHKLIGKKYRSRKWRLSYGNEQRYPVFSAFQTAFSIEKDLFPHTNMISFECVPFEINKKKIDRLAVKSYEYESSFAPEGKTVLQVTVLQNDDDYKYWKGLNRDEYTNRKFELTEILKERIAVKFPELAGYISLLDCWTPFTYEKFCNSYHGAYMSFVTKKNVKSFHVKGTIRGLSNVMIAGQWLHAPGGLPVAAATGKFAVQRILKKEKRNYII